MLNVIFFIFSYPDKCQCGHISELLALTLARKENVAEIVKFYGAKLKGRSASIFMEFMAGKIHKIALFTVAGLRGGVPFILQKNKD